jgi:carbon storage regulator
MIGDDVEIIIVDVRGDKVRLGITAPKNIPVAGRRTSSQAGRRNPGQAGKRASDTAHEEILTAAID